MLPTSKIVNLSPQKCADSLNNGTVQMLVSLYHSHNLCQPANRSRQDMIEQYMKKANLKKNISKALKEIVKSEHEINLEVDDNDHFIFPSGCDEPWASKRIRREEIPINNLSIFEILEELRDRVHQQYSQHSPGLETSCTDFSKSCYSYVSLIEENFHKLKDHHKKTFVQLGGFYVLLDVLQAHEVLLNCDGVHEQYCEEVILRTNSLLLHFSHSSNPISRRQLAGSPFHITMLVNMIRDNYNRNRLRIVRSTTRLLNVLLASIPTIDFNTLQNCQAIQCFTEIMMQTTDNDKLNYDNSFDCMADLMHIIFLTSEPARSQFYQIEGAVEFVISKFTEICRIDDQETSRNDKEKFGLAGNRITILTLMNIITQSFFFTEPEVENFFWTVNVSTIAVELIKQILGDIDPDTVYDMKNLISQQVCLSLQMLYLMLWTVEREQIKVRELVGVEFFRNILTLSWAPDAQDILDNSVGGILSSLNLQ